MFSNTDNFDNIECNLFQPDCVLHNNIENDPDNNFFNDSYQRKCRYFSTDELSFIYNDCKKNEMVKVMHINIRSLKQNFENLTTFLKNINFSFDIICVSETWCSEYEIENNSSLLLTNYNTVHLERKQSKRGGGVLMYIKKNFLFNIREDLKVSDGDKEIITIELILKKTRNILLSCCY